MNKQLINELVKTIKNAATKYYEGYPEITDSEFDALVSQLKSLDPENKILKTPGWGYKPTKNKIEHLIPMGSLEKIHELDDYKDTIKCISLKLDGLSCELVYINGKFQRAVTRGDGKTGIVITKNIHKNIPKSFDTNNNISIRGEIIVTAHDAKKISDKHPRNIASGIVNSLRKNDNADKLKFIPFDIYINGKHLLPIERYNWLHKHWRVNIVPYKIMTNNIDLKDMIDEIKNKAEELGYPYDGMVVENLDSTFIKAYKFEDETHTTDIIDIEWNISDYGKFKPVAIIKPTNIDGSTIRKCTCNNYKWMYNQKIGIGSKIEIVKANQIIPKIVNVLSEGKIKIPTECPICNTKLVIEGVDLMCPNEKCPHKLKMKLVNLFSWFAKDGLGSIIIDKFISSLFEPSNDFMNNFFNKIESVDLEFISQNFGKETSNKLYESVKSFCNDTIKEEVLLLVLCIPNISLHTITSINEKVKTNITDIILNKKWKEIISIGNKHTRLAFSNEFYQNLMYDAFNYFKNRIIKNEPSNDTHKINVCITGKLSVTKNIWADMYKDVIKVTSAVNKKIDYLISNKKSTSSKYKKAIELGIKIITEDEAIQIINELRGKKV